MDILKFISKNKETLLLIFILTLASFFRFYKLDALPPGLYPDEAINGNQAVSEPGKIFYPENNGREGLYINLLSLSFRIFGVSVWSLRFVSAVFGVLTVLGVYLFSKEMFGDFAGMTSAFLLAVSFWHINFSRIVFRAILTPFFLAFAFYFALRAFKRRDLLSSLWAGVFYGLGFHTYISYRLSVLILPFFLLPWFITYLKEKKVKKFLLISGAWMAVTFIAALPIGLYFLENPAHFFGRNSVSVFNLDSPLLKLGESLLRHLAAFNISGDQNWRHNLAGAPALFWLSGTLFLTGFFYSLYAVFKNLIKGVYEKAGNYCLLLSSFFIMLLPGVLTYEGIPHHLRIIGAVSFVFAMAGLGAKIIKEELLKGISNKKVLLIFLFLAAFSAAGFNFYRYFYKWGKSSHVQSAFSDNFVQTGRLITSLAPAGQVVVIVNQGGVLVDSVPMPAQTPMFIERTAYKKPAASYIDPSDLNDVEISVQEKTYLVLLQPEQRVFQALQGMIPGAAIKEKAGVPYLEIDLNKQ